MPVRRVGLQLWLRVPKIGVAAQTRGLEALVDADLYTLATAL